MCVCDNVFVFKRVTLCVYISLFGLFSRLLYVCVL